MLSEGTGSNLWPRFIVMYKNVAFIPCFYPQFHLISTANNRRIPSNDHGHGFRSGASGRPYIISQYMGLYHFFSYQMHSHAFFVSNQRVLHEHQNSGLQLQYFSQHTLHSLSCSPSQFHWNLVSSYLIKSFPKPFQPCAPAKPDASDPQTRNTKGRCYQSVSTTPVGSSSLRLERIRCATLFLL
jgi:hypothetical protein